MRTPEQVKWDFVQQWLDRARKDLAGEKALHLAEETRDLILASLKSYIDAGRPQGRTP
jgi:hypothetical protein